MSSDRLKQLTKQKELLQEHMDWLEQEIAKEQGKPPTSVPASRLETPLEKTEPETPSIPVQPEPVADPEQLSTEQTATDIYNELGPDVTNSAQSARNSCLLIMIIGTVVLGGILGLIYYFYE